MIPTALFLVSYPADYPWLAHAHVEKVYDFLPADLCEPLYRPSDGRLGQIDMLLEPRSAAASWAARWGFP